MKSLQLIILSFVILSIACFGQSTHWIYKQQHPLDGCFTSAVEDNEGFIYTTQRFSNIGNLMGNIKHALLKLNKYGVLQQSINIDSPGDSILELTNLILLPNQNIMAIGVWGVGDYTNLNTLWVSVYNQQLQKLYTKKHTGPNFFLNFQVQKITKTIQNTYAGYTTYMFQNLTNPKSFYYEIDTLGNLVRPISYTNTEVYLADIIQNPTTGAYKGFGWADGSTNNIINYNSQLQYLGYQSIADNVSSFRAAKYINPSHYLFVCTTASDFTPNFNQDRIMVLKKNFLKDSTIQYKIIPGISIIDIDLGASNNSITFIDTNKIFITGQVGWSYIFNNTFKNHLVCVQMDSQLNIKWKKFIGGKAHYQPWNTLATKDGGILIMGSYIDNSMVNQRDALMIKIGPNGEVLNTNELPKGTQVFSYLVGPNPVQNILNIQGFTPNTTIHIVNSLGQVVMQQPITQQQTELNLSHLSTGVYFYRFSSPSGFILQSGKLVKE